MTLTRTGADQALQPRRVVIVTGQLGIGGAERELVTFLDAARGSRFDFKIVCLAPGGEFRAEVSRLVGEPVLSPPSANRLRRLAWMRETLRLLNPALVHSWNLFPMLYLAWGYWHRSWPLVGFLQCIPSQWPGGFVRRRVLRALVRMPDALVSNSQAALDEVSRLGMKVGPAAVVRNGVQRAFFEGPASEEAQRLAGQDLVLIGLGRLIARKRADWMVRCLAKLRLEGLPVALWLVGDGPERACLEDLARNVGVAEKVVFWGSRNDVPRLLGAASIMVHCAWAEGLPNAVQEGMAAGLPVVAARTSGVPEIIEDGKQGLLFSIDDFEGFANSVHTLVTNPDLRQQVGLAARLKAEQDFSPESMASQMIDFYERVLASWPVSSSPPVAAR